MQMKDNFVKMDKIVISSITQKLISHAASFYPLTGYYMLNDSKSSEELDCSQHWISNKVCSLHDSRMHDTTTETNHFLVIHSTTQQIWM